MLITGYTRHAIDSYSPLSIVVSNKLKLRFLNVAVNFRQLLQPFYRVCKEAYN